MIAQTIILAGAVVTALYGGGSWIEDRYAKDEKLTLIAERLEQKIVGDRAAQLQDRLWQLESRYGPDLKRAPESVREEYRRLQYELKDVRQRIERTYDLQGNRER